MDHHPFLLSRRDRWGVLHRSHRIIELTRTTQIDAGQQAPRIA
jgi:hypothetical protein